MTCLVRRVPGVTCAFVIRGEGTTFNLSPVRLETPPDNLMMQALTLFPVYFAQ